jgi:hypothetical protein
VSRDPFSDVWCKLMLTRAGAVDKLVASAVLP